MKFVAAGNPDNKWKISVAGNYKITINQLYETISIVKM
jgi:starch-binding outer membrane protein SusE/F